MSKRIGIVTVGMALLLGCASSASAVQPDHDARVLGPQGYKKLRLGQSERAAEKTGLLVDKERGSGCDFYYLKRSEGRPNVGGGVFVERSGGVVVISGTDKSRTPEGITMGSSLKEVRAAYPGLSPVGRYDSVYESSVPHGESGSHYRFSVDENDRVRDFALEATDRGECAG
jgi:hypothetical protein